MLTSTRNLFNNTNEESNRISKELIQLLDENPTDFLEELNEFLRINSDTWTFFRNLTNDQKRIVIELCHSSDIFLIHKLMSSVVKVDDLKFFKENFQLFNNDIYQNNLEGKSWLQIAILNNRNLDIITFLLDTLKIDPNCRDIYGYTIVHSLCKKESFNEAEFRLILDRVDSENWLMLKAEDGVTPLELACSDENKLNFIMKNRELSIIKSLMDIDNVRNGIIEDLSNITFIELPKEKMWLTILQNNDKQRLMKYIGADNFFINFYLENQSIHEILKKLCDNGLGILSYIKKNILAKDQQNEYTKQECSILKSLTNIAKYDKENQYSYSNSILFIALISGRLELIPILLRSCQFKIIPYSIFTCYLCKVLCQLKELSNHAKTNLKKIKIYCETFAIETLTRIENKETKNQKKILITYLNSKMNCLENFSIIDLAHQADCDVFMNLRLCQTSLDKIWYGRLEKLTESQNFTRVIELIKLTLVSPYFKFYLHSSCYFIFLYVFSFLLVSKEGLSFNSSMIFCWCYVFCYCIEEYRQFYFSYSEGSILHYFTDEANIVDICSISFMITGSLLFTVNKNSNILTSENRLDFWVLFIYGVSLIFFYMRLLYLTYVFEVFGQKLKMFGKMIYKDLAPMLFIFIIFVISFGIMFQSLIFYAKRTNSINYNPSALNFSLDLGNIVRRPTFTIFNAHYILEELETTFKANYRQLAVVYFILIFFCVIVNILLINLLIALFSQTVTEISADSQIKWRANRYKIIKEYSQRTFAPPPINLVFIIKEVVICYKTRDVKKSDLEIGIITEENPKPNPLKRMLTEHNDSSTIMTSRSQSWVHVKEKLKPQGIQRIMSTYSPKNKTFTLCPRQVFTAESKVMFSKNIIQHFSYYVLQAFAMRDCRYNIATSDEERQVQRDSELLNIFERKLLSKIEVYLKRDYNK